MPACMSQSAVSDPGNMPGILVLHNALHFPALQSRRVDEAVMIAAQAGPCSPAGAMAWQDKINCLPVSRIFTALPAKAGQVCDVTSYAVQVSIVNQRRARQTVGDAACSIVIANSTSSCSEQSQQGQSKLVVLPGCSCAWFLQRSLAAVRRLQCAACQPLHLEA